MKTVLYIYVHFEFVTDYDSLTSLKDLKDVGGHLTRWMLYLQQFNFSYISTPTRQTQHNCMLHMYVYQEFVLPQPILQVLRLITVDLDSIKAAHQDNASLSSMIIALTSRQPDVAPGLKHAFLKEGIIVSQVVQNTLGKVKECYYQPGYEDDVVTWIQECRHYGTPATFFHCKL